MGLVDMFKRDVSWRFNVLKSVNGKLKFGVGFFVL